MTRKAIDIIGDTLDARYRAERRFRWCGRMAIGFGILCLVLLFTDIIGKGIGAFRLTHIQLPVHFDTDLLGMDSTTPADEYGIADWDGLYKAALKKQFPGVTKRKQRKQLNALVSSGSGYELLNMVRNKPELLGQTVSVWLVADDDIDTYFKTFLDGDAYAARVSAAQQSWIASLYQQGMIELQFNSRFFTNGDSREPEMAGIWGATVGSFLVLLITLFLSFPIGVAAAIYLEEFAPVNRFTDII